ncbi:GtrA family protein [Roseovarius nanhaiticus]|uniref:GtrA family protein n=1 Tax=Roseovarius nanhaiticus TaxID=573024 RepID=UPI002492BD8B|nr:GtrA family protein [Roseovarius nanhaiticus]
MISQLIRFGLVGGAATLVHLLVGVTLIHAGWMPILANAAAFCIAFFVSFAGHFGYTFAASNASMRAALIRFIAVALSGFAANEALLAGLLSRHLLSPSVTLVLTTGLVALATFALARKWAFAAT